MFPTKWSLFVFLVVKIVMGLSTVMNATEPQGRLLLFGGSERDNNPLLWDAFVQAAGGPGARIAIFPTASSFPERTGTLYAGQMKQLGLEPFVVPLSPLLKGTDSSAIAQDREWSIESEMPIRSFWQVESKLAIAKR